MNFEINKDNALSACLNCCVLLQCGES